MSTFCPQETLHGLDEMKHPILSSLVVGVWRNPLPFEVHIIHYTVASASLTVQDSSPYIKVFYETGLWRNTVCALASLHTMF